MYLLEVGVQLNNFEEQIAQLKFLIGETQSQIAQQKIVSEKLKRSFF